MISCDSSVLIAAFARWHEHHKEAADAVSQVDALIDHTVIEAFSVLTRLPPPRRAPAALVATFLRHHFPASIARLSGPPAGDVIRTAEGTGIAGGAVYDLLIGLTAADAGATLLSRECPWRGARAGLKMGLVAACDVVLAWRLGLRP